ncbi:MAG: DUF262 domain-containing protein [Muribaculaceae bacterium]|nr:DUF262 domain-containing protein [Muribaculaceae bacterium]
MLKRNIVLPDYQRSFVWDTQDVEELVKSFKTGQFIQPVTIARMNSIGGINIILDGQQRLTSILLLSIGYFPKKEKFKESALTTSDDDSADSNSFVESKIIDWTFEKLLKEDISQNSVLSIKSMVSADDKYEALSVRNPNYLMTGKKLDEFLDNNFLGFSFIVPDIADSADEQKFFTTLFRNMNYLGKKLSPIESRKSLYYLNDIYKNYFEGKLEDGSEALGGLKIMDNVAPGDIDFVRYLSILSQYDEKSTKARKVMVGYSSYSSREKFYVDYVSYILGIDQEERADKFNKFNYNATFGSASGFQQRFQKLKQTIEALKGKMSLDSKYPDAFKSWIDADYWLFGLIYWIVFKGKEITLDPDWTPKLKKEIQNKRKNPNDSYVKSPNMLSHLRDRVERSIDLIKKYVK